MKKKVSEVDYFRDAKYDLKKLASDSPEFQMRFANEKMLVNLVSVLYYRLDTEDESNNPLSLIGDNLYASWAALCKDDQNLDIYKNQGNLFSKDKFSTLIIQVKELLAASLGPDVTIE